MKMTGKWEDAPKVLAVDFDGTLTQGDVMYWDGEEPDLDEQIADYVRQHYYDGGIVLVWTARPWSEASSIAGHMAKWEIPYHAIRCEKGSADVYLDDKALHPEEVENDGQ